MSEKNIISDVEREIFERQYKSVTNIVYDDEKFLKLDLKQLLELQSKAITVQGEYKNLEITIKKDGNSCYGALGSEYFPLVNFECAEDITNAGKHYTCLVDYKINMFHKEWGENELKIIQEFYPNVTRLRQFTEYVEDTENDLCVYGDTDSRYVDFYTVYSLLYVGDFNNLFPDTSTEKGRKELSDFSVFIVENFYNGLIERVLNEDLEFRNARKGYLKMAHEVTSIKSVFRAKKNYILPIVFQDGVYLDEVKFKSVGVEIKKGGLSAMTKKIIERLLNYFLLENKSQDFLRNETLKIIRYLKERAEKKLISRITSVNNLHEIYFDKDSNMYKSNMGHQSMKVALSWYNFIHRNNLQHEYKPPFNGQKMFFYYDTEGGVMGVPDDVDIDSVNNLPLPDYVRMVKDIIIKNLFKYISTKSVKEITDKDVDNFIAGIRTIEV